VIGQFRFFCKAMFHQTKREGSAALIQALFRRVAWLLLALVSLLAPSLAQDNPSGLPLPRFASTRSEPINVRVGPGTKYEVAWTYLKAGIPVEIVQEFDTWRKIRDVDGTEGWVHQNLLSGTRAGYASPLMANGEIALRSSRSDEGSVRARLGPGLKVVIKECDGSWCEVTASHQDKNQRTASYSGFMRQEELWGVYPQEVFD
jgi:SH3-like domain-containing protein